MTPLRLRDAELDALATPYAGGSVAGIALGTVLGTGLGLLVLPRWLPALAASLGGEAPEAYWQLSRVTGLTSYALLWGSTLLGLGISSRLSRDHGIGAAAFDLHQHLSWLALASALAHAGLLLGDRYIGFSIADVALPFFSSRYRPLAVSLGQLAVWGMLFAGLGFYARRELGRVTWRWLHASGGLAFVLATLHGVSAGTSASDGLIQALYWGAAGSVLLLFFYRLLVVALVPTRRDGAA
jgi:predicted ferric reductase